MNGYKGKMGVVVGVADPRMPMHGFLCSGAGCSNDYKMAWWGSIHPLNIYNLKYQPTLVYSYLKKELSSSGLPPTRHPSRSPMSTSWQAQIARCSGRERGWVCHMLRGMLSTATTETTIPPDELIGLFQGGLVGICWSLDCRNCHDTQLIFFVDEVSL